MRLLLVCLYSNGWPHSPVCLDSSDWTPSVKREAVKLGKMYDVESLGGIGRGSGVKSYQNHVYIGKLLKKQNN